MNHNHTAVGSPTEPPGRHYQILPGAPRAPDWWILLYLEQQTTLRAAIRQVLARTSRPLTADELPAYVPCRDDREIADAVQFLLADGSIEESGPPYRHNGRTVPRYRATRKEGLT